MLIYKKIHGIVEPPYAVVGGTFHTFPLIMYNLCVRHIMDLISGLNGSVTIIKIFTEHEKSFIQFTHRFQDLSSKNHERTAHSFNRVMLIRIEVSKVVAACPFSSRK